MPLISATILPHSPLLLPGLTDEARAAVSKTTTAIGSLSEKILSQKPDVIFIISAHTGLVGGSNKYALLQGPKFNYVFNQFGDLVTSGSIKGAIGFTHHLKEKLETKFPLPLVSAELLPYTFAIPLVCLGATINSLPIACLQIPKEISADEIKRLATLLSEEISAMPERVAIIATGNLSHNKETSNTQAKIFDQLFQAACQENSLNKLTNMDVSVRREIEECLWSPTTLLYSLLGEQKVSTQIISYEASVGIGFLVAEINID
jgi:aromatic ring-opening dioxygenase LigB subunit